MLFIANSLYAQGQIDNACIPLMKQDKTKFVVKGIHAKEIISKGAEFELVATFDLEETTIKIHEDPTYIIVINKNRIDYITPDDKLTFKGRNKFEVVYGGSGPERQIFEILYDDNNCILLESTPTSKGYINGELVYKRTRTIRYLWERTLF